MQGNRINRRLRPPGCKTWAMNFFQRRKILKKANFLDLHPVRVLKHETGENGNIVLLLPRFRKKIETALFQSPNRDPLIRIRLDQYGSRTWMLIDSAATVREICSRLQEAETTDTAPLEETETRVTKFLSLLYRERYITFREIEDV